MEVSFQSVWCWGSRTQQHNEPWGRRKKMNSQDLFPFSLLIFVGVPGNHPTTEEQPYSEKVKSQGQPLYMPIPSSHTSSFSYRLKPVLEFFPFHIFSQFKKKWGASLCVGNRAKAKETLRNANSIQTLHLQLFKKTFHFQFIMDPGFWKVNKYDSLGK